MDGAAREAYLDEACAGEVELRRQVESLISSGNDSQQIFDGVLADQAAALTDINPGDRIGQYEVVRQLGQGGMGSVYLAVRADDQFRKQVAIKLMRPDFLSRSTVERFRTERQILANLEHPGIARLLDGGTTRLEFPYVVMEYVDGVPVDVYCQRWQISIRHRIQLFRRIVDAVIYAHRNLIVHRDIKPENVLVTGQGEPKLLDFGIAKLLQAGDSATAGSEALTLAAERLMTPDYASPEQASGGAITTLSDVYSLGVLLYKLLTGRVPFQITSRRAAEIEREICETAPMRPSIAAGRSGEWLGLGKEATRDLDTILLVALHKEPSRRYASVEHFSADLGRFLDGFPVLARGDSFRYRTVKLVRRRPFAVAAVSFVLVLIVGSSIGMAVLARRAREEAQAANEVTDFLVNIFESNDPASGRGDKVTARELLDRGAQQLDDRLKNNPKVQARLYDTVGALYNALGSSQKAEELLRRSLELRRNRLSMTDEAAGDTLDNLGDVALDLSRYKEAEGYYREALAVHLKRSGINSTAVAEEYARISSALWDMGRFSEAEALDRQAIALESKLKGKEDRVVLDMQNDLGTVFYSEGRYQEAVIQAKYVLDARSRIEAPDHLDLGYSWHNYSQALMRMGRFPEAEDAERRSVAVRIHVYGENHPQVAMTQGELAGLLLKTGKFDEAFSLVRHAFDLEMKVYGARNRDTNYCQTHYATALLAAGETAAAREQAQQALDTRMAIVPAGHPQLADSWETLGTTDMALGNLPLAIEEFRQAMDLLVNFYGQQHVLVANAQIFLAEALMQHGELAQAEVQAASALAKEQANSPADLSQVGLAESALGRILLAGHHADKALPLLQDAFKNLSGTYGPNHPQTASTGIRLAEAMAANGQMDAALRLARQEAPFLLQSHSRQWSLERTVAERMQHSGGSALLHAAL